MFVVNNLGLEATSTGAIVSFVPPEIAPICAHPLLLIEMVYAVTKKIKEYKMLFMLIKVFCIANLTGFCYSMVGVNHKVPLIQKNNNRNSYYKQYTALENPPEKIRWAWSGIPAAGVAPVVGCSVFIIQMLPCKCSFATAACTGKTCTISGSIVSKTGS